jgi:hypothetical protein
MRSSGPDTLRTPAPSTGYVRDGAPLTVRSASTGLANQAIGIELTAPRYPVTSAADLLVSRRPEGGAQVRHRRGGSLIGDITFSDEKGWQAVYGGKALKSHAHQRPALAELVSVWNTGTASLERPAGGLPLQQPPQQTPLMQQYGVPAINALATPTTGYSDGPRTTSASSDNDEDDSSGSGLNAKGQSVFKKLKARGWPDAKAMAFAKRAQNFGGGGS